MILVCYDFTHFPFFFQAWTSTVGSLMMSRLDLRTPLLKPLLLMLLLCWLPGTDWLCLRLTSAVLVVSDLDNT